jgi:hypothetical protein
VSQRQDRRKPLGASSSISDKEHFLYRTTAPQLDPIAIETVVDAVVCSDQRPTGPRVNVLETKSDGPLSSPRVRSAYRRLAKAVKRHTGTEGAADILACEWAQPHVDAGFVGTVFYSVVLHTGPHAYLMQAFHTEPNSNGYEELTTTELVLSTGFAFVFDPTRAHLAIPMRPHQGQLLVLLQVELDDCTDEQREAIIKRLPPCV